MQSYRSLIFGALVLLLCLPAQSVSAQNTPNDSAPETPPSEEAPAKDEDASPEPEQTKETETESVEEEDLFVMPDIGGEEEPAEETPVEQAPVNQPIKAGKSEKGDLETPDVVITGTMLERKLEDSPVRTQVINREQIEERKVRNLSEALNYTTGVRVESNCQNCGFTQLRLNGLNGAYTQVLIDGMPSFSGLAAVYGLEQLPAELIERVEVVKGGGSALYGPSAVAGVVNLITRRPKENFVSALASYDHLGLEEPDMRLSVDGGVVSQSGRSGAHIFVTSRRRDPLDLNGDGFTEVTALRQLAGGSNFFFTPFDGGDLRLSFHAVQEYRRGGDQLDLPPHAAAIAEE